MEHRIRLNLFSTALVVAIGLGVSVVTSTLLVSRAYTQRGEREVVREQTITVKGSTRERIQSDLAVWHIRLQGEGPTLKEAFAILDDGVGRVRQFLTQRSFGPAEIGLGAIHTEEIYARDEDGDRTNTIESYRLQRTFFLTTADVDRVRRTAGEVTQLIEEGVYVVSLPPEYYYTRLPELKVAIMGSASCDARARADEIARNAGCRVAEVRTARMGVLQITRPHSTEVSGYGIYDTSTIEKDVRAVVTLTLGIGAS